MSNASGDDAPVGGVVSRWEHGSEFHLEPLSEPVGPCAHPWGSRPDAASYYGCGRDALAALLQLGQREGWGSVWVPDFLCQEVVATLVSCTPRVRLYADGPGPALGNVLEVPAAAGDAVLVVNHFGLRRAPEVAALRARGLVVIEDHTHAPWSDWAYASSADYGLASLRKCLPVPDGAVLWSPVGLTVPEPVPVTPVREHAAHRKLAAMVLKGLYLNGHPVAKDAFRSLSIAGERDLASGAVSGMSAVTRELLRCLPIQRWRQMRQANRRVLLEALADVGELAALEGEGPQSEPFNATFVCTSAALRDRLRSGLVEARIYPVVLWPLETPCAAPVSAAALDLSRRILGIHCDLRYGSEDMRRVAERLRALVARGA